jgi:GTP-binding protein Era
MSEQTQDQLCGFAAVIGPSNAGKSTLINRLVGAKVSITSRKLQTTRNQLRGIFTQDNAQIILVDTPGIFAHSGRRLDRSMVDAAWRSALDTDITVLVLDARRAPDSPDHLELIDKLAGIRDADTRCVLVLNKIDTIKRDLLLPRIDAYNKRMNFDATYLVSALKDDGVDDLRDDLGRHMPVSPWHYDPEMISDASMRMLAAEVTREKIYDRLHREIPYAITVHTDSWEEPEDNAEQVVIHQTIYVMRDSQRGIVLGKQGQTLKEIGKQARLELADMLERRVHLDLHVKVKSDWDERPEFFEALGLEY